MFRIEMLQAEHGDALLIEYGEGAATHRILVDGGPYFTYQGLRDRLLAIPERDRKLDLLVVTHIDSDHVEGIIRLLHDPGVSVEIGDVWFNDSRHAVDKPPDELGPMQGEFLGALIEQRKLPWNHVRKGDAIVTKEGELWKTGLDGGAEVVLLSPGPRELTKLGKEWRKVLDAEGFKAGDRDAALRELEKRARYQPPADLLGSRPQSKPANASSIAFLLTYDGKRLLLTGDADPDVLVQAIGAMGQGVLDVDAWKLSHHGSYHNISLPLARLVRARRYLVSTSGKFYDHPDEATIELILQEREQEGSGPRPIELVFNYDSDETKPWSDSADQRARRYTARYDGKDGVDVG